MRLLLTNERIQVSASLLVVVGLLCLTNATLFDGDGQLPDAFVLPLLRAVLPWLSGKPTSIAGCTRRHGSVFVVLSYPLPSPNVHSLLHPPPHTHTPHTNHTGTHVTTRVIGQMVAFRLLTRARASGLLEKGEVGGLDKTYLDGTLAFLEGNKEMSSVRRKEQRRFESVSVTCCCSVAGVMGHALVDGDFTATHLEITLREVRCLGWTELGWDGMGETLGAGCS
jgi:hypothetical protein